MLSTAGSAVGTILGTCLRYPCYASLHGLAVPWPVRGRAINQLPLLNATVRVAPTAKISVKLGGFRSGAGGVARRPPCVVLHRPTRAGTACVGERFAASEHFRRDRLAALPGVVASPFVGTRRRQRRSWRDGRVAHGHRGSARWKLWSHRRCIAPPGSCSLWPSRSACPVTWATRTRMARPR